MNDDRSPGFSAFLNRIDWKETDSITIEGRLLTIKVRFQPRKTTNIGGQPFFLGEPTCMF